MTEDLALGRQPKGCPETTEAVADCEQRSSGNPSGRREFDGDGGAAKWLETWNFTKFWIIIN